MATAAIPGFKARIYVATSSGAAMSKFGELVDVTLNIAMAAMDATSKDSAGWKENVPGLREWGLSGSAMYLGETTDAGQALFWAEIGAQSSIYLQLYELSTAIGNVMWVGNATVTQFDLESPLDKTAGHKFAAKGTGPLTKSATT